MSQAGTDAGFELELEDDPSMCEPVDRHGHHRIFEDAIPLREHQVRCQHERPVVLISPSDKGEEDLHLIGRVLHVPDVVEDDHVKLMRLFEILRQPMLGFGLKQLRHEPEGRHEPYLHLVLSDELASNDGAEVTLALRSFRLMPLRRYRAAVRL